MLLGCWLVVPCGAMRRKRRAARGCDSSGQAQGSCGGNASVCQLDPSRECAGFQQAPSLLGAKEMAGVGDEVPGNPPPVRPVPAVARCHNGLFFLHAVAAQQSLDRLRWPMLRGRTRGGVGEKVNGGGLT